MTPVMQRPDYAEIARLRRTIDKIRSMIARACDGDLVPRTTARMTSIQYITHIARTADRMTLDLIPLLAADGEFQARMQAVLR